MANKKKMTPAEKESLLKKIAVGVLVVAVAFISGGKVDLRKNMQA